VAVFLLGASLTKGLDRVARGGRTGTALVVVGAIAAFAMGANDVSNASGALVGTHVFGPLGAGYVFGLLVR